MADHHGFAFAHRQVGNNTVEGSSISSFFSKHRRSEVRVAWFWLYMLIGGIFLRLCLRDNGIALEPVRKSAVAQGVFCGYQKSDLGDQTVFKTGSRRVPNLACCGRSRLGPRRRSASEVSQRGMRCQSVGLGSLQRSLIGVHVPPTTGHFSN